MRYFLVFLVLTSATVFAGEPIKVCIAQPSGAEAKNWKLQGPVAKRLEQQAASKQMEISAPTLLADSEKKAKAEASEKGCTYVLLSSIEASKDEVFAALNPSPTARPQADASRSLNATPAGFTIKYKLITTDGKKIVSSSVAAPLSQNPTTADFQETGIKLVDGLATQVLSAVSTVK